MSPTSFSLLLMRNLGYRAEVVEKFNPHAKVRQDLFGFIDVLAIRPQRIVAVQTTSMTNIRSRIRKALDSDAYAQWIAAGGAFEVHAWAKTKPRGMKLRIHTFDRGDDGGRIIRFASQKLEDAAELMRDAAPPLGPPPIFTLDGHALNDKPF